MQHCAQLGTQHCCDTSWNNLLLVLLHLKENRPQKDTLKLPKRYCTVEYDITTPPWWVKEGILSAIQVLCSGKKILNTKERPNMPSSLNAYNRPWILYKAGRWQISPQVLLRRVVESDRKTSFASGKRTSKFNMAVHWVACIDENIDSFETPILKLFN